MQDDELYAIKDRAAERLLAVPGVTTVGLGGRERAGEPTGEVVIKVFVSAKRPAGQVPPQQLIPAEFEGVPTDVVEMGPLEISAAPLGRAAVAPGEYDLARRRPLIGGSAVVNEFNDSLTGTLGCFLVDGQDPAKVYALTNFHIARPDRGRVRQAQQCGVADRSRSCGAVAAGPVRPDLSADHRPARHRLRGAPDLRRWVRLRGSPGARSRQDWLTTGPAGSS